ncbi:nitric oxide synthase oxygenase [Streptomyces sp. NPDC006285]|uniref:nitric oxide synthase oxygenase n=1 Tax=Streptomyces sp. NPDC006285 TaxID=3364742 RepID=UPI0036A3F264
MNPEEARNFLEMFQSETGTTDKGRITRALGEIKQTGLYAHTPDELAWGARVAWRNSSRCIGRLYWNSLHVRDRRHVKDPSEVARECADHLASSWRGGRIRPTITVFASDDALGPQVRIINEQLVRYAAYRRANGSVLGDGKNIEVTDLARKLGWTAASPSAFDVLPLIVEDAAGNIEWYELPRSSVNEVQIFHPDLPEVSDLQLRWHAIPAISNMVLEIGGVRYSAAPFNGWYMGTEIGARNLVDSDRYDVLPAIAEIMGIGADDERSLWRDRALIELNRAILHSFDQAGVSITDHHTESHRFLQHVAKEERAGRSCPVDWSWVVPPLSASLTGVYHRYYDPPDPERRPAFLER